MGIMMKVLDFSFTILLGTFLFLAYRINHSGHPKEALVMLTFAVIMSIMYVLDSYFRKRLFKEVRKMDDKYNVAIRRQHPRRGLRIVKKEKK